MFTWEVTYCIRRWDMHLSGWSILHETGSQAMCVYTDEKQKSDILSLDDKTARIIAGDGIRLTQDPEFVTFGVFVHFFEAQSVPFDAW